MATAFYSQRMENESSPKPQARCFPSLGLCSLLSEVVFLSPCSTLLRAFVSALWNRLFVRHRHQSPRSASQLIYQRLEADRRQRHKQDRRLMRSLPVRRILPAHPLSLAHHHSPSSIRITSCSRPTIPTSQDSPWQLCFQRAYSRTVLSRDQPRRPTRPCPRQQYTSSGPIPSATAGSGVLSRKYQRSYTSAAAAAQPIPKETHGSISTTSHASNPIGGGPTPKRESRSTQDLMAQLGQSLKDRNLSSALDIYLVVRRRTLPADQVESLFHFQRQLVQLFHFTTLQKSASDRAGLGQQFSKQLSQLDQRRNRVLRHISERMLIGDDHAKALTGLVDAIGRSRAMVQHSYISNSSGKLQDWRKALKVLEDWSAAEKPWDWRKNATEGVVAKESGPSLKNIPAWRNAVLERELGSWLVKLMSKLVYSHTYLVRSMLDTIPKQFGIRTTVDMHLVSHLASLLAHVK